MFTNYQRYTTVNGIGLSDIDYVNAMIDVAKKYSVPVFDDYRCCGISFLNADQKAWIDEAKNRQKLVDGEIVYYDDVEHFSVEAYEWMTSLYEHIISDL